MTPALPLAAHGRAKQPSGEETLPAVQAEPVLAHWGHAPVLWLPAWQELWVPRTHTKEKLWFPLQLYQSGSCMAVELAEVGELSQLCFMQKKHQEAWEFGADKTLPLAPCQNWQVCWDSQEPTVPPVASQHNLLHNPRELRSASRPLDIIFPNLFSSFTFKASLNSVLGARGAQWIHVQRLDQHCSSEQLQSSHIVTPAQRKVEQQLLTSSSFSTTFREYLSI